MERKNFECNVYAVFKLNQYFRIMKKGRGAYTLDNCTSNFYFEWKALLYYDVGTILLFLLCRSKPNCEHHERTRILISEVVLK